MTEQAYVPYSMRDVNAAMARSRFTFGSGFSGAGGADLGYCLAGGRGIFGVELDAEAVRTFGRNFPETFVEHGDFREVANTPDIIDRLLHQGNLSRGELDIFHASPPCAEFSRLGTGPREGGSAGLIFDVVTMTQIIRPRILIIENVPELATRHRAYLDAALAQLGYDETGRRLYYVNVDTLNAEAYGVPQRRRRLFLIAVRADVAGVVGIKSDIDVLLLFPASTHDPITLESAWDGLEQNDWELHPYRRAMMTSNLGHLVRQIPHDPYRWMTPRKAGRGAYRYTTVRPGICLPSPTVTASGQQPDGRSGILHSFDHRKISLREMMRCCSFPEDLVFTGTVAQAATRIGMSVPPLMTKAIADDLYECVLRPYHESIRGRY